MNKLFINKSLKLALVSLLFLFLIPAKCQNIKIILAKEKKWAIQIGAGIMYGGNVGVLIEKQIHLKNKLHISPFVSAGIAEAGTDSITLHKLFWFGNTIGCSIEFGNKHRIFLGSHLAGNELIGKSTIEKKNFFGGLSSVIGYKGFANFGLMWQIYLGDFYSPDDDPFSDDKKYMHRSHLGVGIGYRF